MQTTPPARSHRTRTLLIVAGALLGFAVAPLAQADTFEAMVGAQHFVATQTVAARTKIAGKDVINVTGHMKAKAMSSIGFNITGTSPGHYPIQPGNPAITHGNYNADVMAMNIDDDVYSFQSGAVDITAVDPVRGVSGTFTATAKSRSGKSIAITAGSFRDIPLR